MFERYTEKALRVIFFARYEASQYGSPEIDTEHVLLGLLRESKDLYRWLENASLEWFRRKIEQRLPRGAPTSTAIGLPLSEAAKRVLSTQSMKPSGLPTNTLEPNICFWDCSMRRAASQQGY